MPQKQVKIYVNDKVTKCNANPCMAWIFYDRVTMSPSYSKKGNFITEREKAILNRKRG